MCPGKAMVTMNANDLDLDVCPAFTVAETGTDRGRRTHSRDDTV